MKQQQQAKFQWWHGALVALGAVAIVFLVIQFKAPSSSQTISEKIAPGTAPLRVEDPKPPSESGDEPNSHP